MRAGRLRHRVTIEQATEAQTGTGEPQKTWTTYATRWGAIEPVVGSGREFFDARHIASEADTVILLRHLSGLTTKMRAKDRNGIAYDIKHIANVQEIDHEMRLFCVRRSIDN